MRKIKIVLGLVLLTTLLVLFSHNVPTKVIPEDQEALQYIFEAPQIDVGAASFEEEIEFIDFLVNRLHQKYEYYIPIDYNEKREPSDLIANQ